MGSWTTDPFTLCSEFMSALDTEPQLEECRCFKGDCPNRDDDHVVCPSGFWGFRHEIGWPLSNRDGSPLTYEMSFEGEPHLTIGVSTDLALYDEHAKRIRALGNGVVVESREKLSEELKQPGLNLVYLYCHGGVMAGNVPFVEIGPANSRSITPAWIRKSEIRWELPRPLVFINGCQTTALEPEQAIDLVRGFVRTANALGVIGTEITVFEELACSYAERMLAGFMDGSHTVGAATRAARLELLRQRNPLGSSTCRSSPRRRGCALIAVAP